MKDLHTLALAHCGNLILISTLNPDRNSDKIVLCPKLEELVIYNKRPDQFHLDELLSMAEERALRGVKLLGITIVRTDVLASTEEVLQLRKHVSRAEHKSGNAPAWDALPVT